MPEIDPIKSSLCEYCGTGLIGDFVAWITKRLPGVSALELCSAVQPEAYDFFSCHTTDPYVPTPQLLELISNLLRSREVMSVYADSAYRWLPSTIKQLCPAAKVYGPTSQFRSGSFGYRLTPADFWQDQLFPNSYQAIESLGDLNFDAVAMIEYEERHDYDPSNTDVGTNKIYYELEFIQSLAERVSGDGVFIWVDCEFDLKSYEPLRSGQVIRAGELRKTLASCGFQLDAVFESEILSGDSDRPASNIVSANVYVFQRTDQKLAPAAYDARESLSLEEQLADSGPGELQFKDAPGIESPIVDYRSGTRKHLIVDDLFPGIRALEQKTRLREISREHGFKLVPWLEVFEPGGIGCFASDERRDNSRLVTVKDEDAWRREFLARNQSDQDYLQRFFESELGRTFISSCAVGRKNLKNWEEYYEASKIPMPKDPETQREIVRASRLIDEIANQLEDHARQVWTGELGKLKSIRNQLNLLKSGDSIASWARSLCLPLASICVPYSINSTESNNDKVKRLLRFFEWLTAWLAVLNLSLAKKDPKCWQEVISKLSRQKQHLSIRALPFGGWRTILDVVQSAIRQAGSLDASSRDSLDAIRPVLARLNDIRNDWDGHGGLEVGVEISQSRIEELDGALTQARKYLNHLLARYRLVLPGRGEQTEEGYLCSFEELTGPSAPFPTIERLLSCPPPVKGRLYVLEDETSTLTQLFPLIRIENYKAFFYGRINPGGYTFVSHHSPDSPQTVVGREQVPELTDLIDAIG